MTNESRDALKRLMAAVGTLEDAGYTYVDGAERWRPPLGQRPPLERKPFCDELEDHLQKYECCVIGKTNWDLLCEDAAKWRRFQELVDPKDTK